MDSKRVIGSPVDLALTAKVARGERLTPAELELWLGAPPATVFRKMTYTKGKPPHDGKHYVVIGGFGDGPCVICTNSYDGKTDDYETLEGSVIHRRLITHYLELPSKPEREPEPEG